MDTLLQNNLFTTMSKIFQTVENGKLAKEITTINNSGAGITILAPPNAAISNLPSDIGIMQVLFIQYFLIILYHNKPFILV